MSSGSADEPLISAMPLGPAGFVAAMINTAVLEFISLTAWSAVYFLALAITVPIVLVNAAVAYVMVRAGQTIGRIGGGMLVACATTVITQVIVGTAFLVIAI